MFSSTPFLFLLAGSSGSGLGILIFLTMVVWLNVGLFVLKFVDVPFLDNIILDSVMFIFWPITLVIGLIMMAFDR